MARVNHYFEMFIGNHSYIVCTTSSRKTRAIVQYLFNKAREAHGNEPVKMADYEYDVLKHAVQEVKLTHYVTDSGVPRFVIKSAKGSSTVDMSEADWNKDVSYYIYD